MEAIDVLRPQHKDMLRPWIMKRALWPVTRSCEILRGLRGGVGVETFETSGGRLGLNGEMGGNRD